MYNHYPYRQISTTQTQPRGDSATEYLRSPPLRSIASIPSLRRVACSLHLSPKSSEVTVGPLLRSMASSKRRFSTADRDGQDHPWTAGAARSCTMDLWPESSAMAGDWLERAASFSLIHWIDAVAESRSGISVASTACEIACRSEDPPHKLSKKLAFCRITLLFR